MCSDHETHGLGVTGTDAASTGAVRTHFAVEGMTCSHCVASVTEELSTLGGVHSVDVRLNAGGTSQVMVTSDAELDSAAIRAAIDEAGYSLVEA